MRALLLAALVLTLAAIAIVPAADAQPPGGDCDVKEEYVTESSLGRDANGLPTFSPGAPRPVECYY